MRVAGGRFKGRPLTGPRSQSIRPTSDRTREAVFNILTHRDGFHLDGARVLDLFAGTGALGIEALSRGASFVLFVETGAEGRAAIRENTEKLGLGGTSKIYRRDATAPGEPGTLEPFDLLFMDPPYGKGLGEKALLNAISGGWLKGGAGIVWEEAAGTEIAVPSSVEEIDRRVYGAAQVFFGVYRA